jgi:hypothetical protein
LAQASRLPYGKQFSPSQGIDLTRVLALAAAHEGDRAALQRALRSAYFDARSASESNRDTLALNLFLSLRSYALVEGGERGVPYALSATGRGIRSIRGKRAKLDKLAEHILTNLSGMQMLEAISSIQSQGRTVTVHEVARVLRGIGVDPGGSSGENINPMRLWLEQAGVLNGWEIDNVTLKRIVGASADEISDLAALPVEQRALLLALASMSGSPPFVAASVRALAETQVPGLSYDIKTFAKSVLTPLESAGWISVRKTTAGRGAKSHSLTPTSKFTSTIREPLAIALATQVHLYDPASLRRPLADLLTIVTGDASSPHERGLALEGVCVQLIWLMGARFVSWRRRGDETSGAEVDVIAELAERQYWLVQVQSKASAISGRDVVDREVGVAQTLKSNVLLLVSARRVGEAARRAADRHMQETGLAILFIDGSDLRAARSGAEIAGALGREWARVERVRSPRGRERATSVRSGA